MTKEIDKEKVEQDLIIIIKHVKQYCKEYPDIPEQNALAKMFFKSVTQDVLNNIPNICHAYAYTILNYVEPQLKEKGLL